MSIAIYPTKSRSEDQPLRFDGGSHKTRQEMKTALKKHSQGSEKEAYIGGEFKRRKDTWRCQNSGRVLCLRHSSICFRKNKILCLNIQNYLLLTFVFHFLLFLLYLFFFFFNFHRSAVENWWFPIPGKVMQECIPVLEPIWWGKETVIQQSWLSLVKLSFNL